MEIRFKDGKPLLVGGGLIAGSQKCCCENPPPPRCWCPDYCQYNIEVILPETCSVSTRPGCADYQTRTTIGSSIASVLEPYPGVLDCPGETSGVGGLPCSDGSYVQRYDAWVGGWGLLSAVNTDVIKRPEAGIIYGVRAAVRYEARVRCIMEDLFNASKILLDVVAGVYMQKLSSESESDFSFTRTRFKTVEISYDECQKVGDRVCNNTDLYRKNAKQKSITTPLEFTLSLETTSFGDYDQTNDILQFGPYEDLLQSIIDKEFNATFRITSRPTCRSVPADCDVPIGEGNTRVFWGGETPEFVLGTPELMSVTDPVTNDLLYYEHQGGIGTIVNPYKFFFYRTDNPNTQTLEQQYLDLYCESDNNVSPPVTAWYVVHQTIKYCAGPFTVDQWAGTIDTYAAPENCGNISAGDPVPIGEPTMERSIGYPQDSTGGCGATAPRIRFEIQAPCSV